MALLGALGPYIIIRSLAQRMRFKKEENVYIYLQHNTKKIYKYKSKDRGLNSHT